MHRQYERNYLSKVIARIDFASLVPQLGQEGLAKQVATHALQHFPIADHEDRISVTLDATGTSKQIQRISTFYGRSREKKLAIAPDHFYVEARQYRNYRTFREEFLSLTDVLMNYYGLEAKRFGLRYINTIEPGGQRPTAWRMYIDNHLLSSLRFLPNRENLARAFHTLAINRGEWMLVFKYGLYNPDYPAVIRKKQFILDYDAYCEGLIASADIERYMDEFHSGIVEFFELSITDRLRGKMGVIAHE